MILYCTANHLVRFLFICAVLYIHFEWQVLTNDEKCSDEFVVLRFDRLAVVYRIKRSLEVYSAVEMDFVWAELRGIGERVNTVEADRYKSVVHVPMERAGEESQDSMAERCIGCI